MTWGKVDDQFHAHRKTKVAWKACRASLGLHLMALSYCAGHLTDGLVDHEFVEEKLPVARERKQATEALVSAGLWVPENDGWRINDWLEYNPSRADVIAKRERDSARKSRGGAGDSKRSPNGIPADSKRHPGGVRTASRAGAPGRVSRPDPTRPLPPLPPEGGRTRDRIAYEGELAEFCAEQFPGIDVGYIEHFASDLRMRGQEPTVEALRPLVEQYRTAEAPAT